jgi:threonine/homoserine/homoserine lactone efflux protein
VGGVLMAAVIVAGFALGWCIFTGRIPGRASSHPDFDKALPRLVGGIFMLFTAFMMAALLHSVL